MEQLERFVFRRHDKIGDADADEDRLFLPSCFVDKGDLDVLANCTDPRRIVVGRTGSGKTALLKHLSETKERIIDVSPDLLSLPYISNSTILNFVTSLGVNLDVFFKMLWRHVFAVELLKRIVPSDQARNKRTWLDLVRDLFREKKRLPVFDYIEKWGGAFWEQADAPMREATTKLEKDLSASLKFGTGVAMGAEAASKLSHEEKQEIVSRAQNVVAQVQIRQLSEILDALNDILDDPQRRFYILVDRLDENWVEERLRYPLIRALVETVRDFKKVQNVKVIVALRMDLLDRVIRRTRDSGFQEEKYESLYLPLRWEKEQLIQILDRRISHLVRSRYSSQKRVTYADVLPSSIGREPVLDYLLARTMMRPRDLISFFNYCVAQADKHPRITAEMIKGAEGEYSRSRLRSLADEWAADLPNLLVFTEIVKNRPSHFRLSDISNEACMDFCLNAIISGFDKQDELSVAAAQVVDTDLGPREFRRSLAHVFYKVGLFGLKVSSHEKTMWSTDGRRAISSAEIADDTGVDVHAFAWRTLGIRPPKAG
jgi:hypothetical protein